MPEELCYRTKMNQAMVLKSDRLPESWPELGRPIKKKWIEKECFLIWQKYQLLWALAPKSSHLADI